MIERDDTIEQNLAGDRDARTVEPDVPEDSLRSSASLSGWIGTLSIRFKLLSAFAAISTLTVVATLAALLAYSIVGKSLREIETESLPGMTHAFVLARQAAELSAISAAIAAAENAENLEQAKAASANVRHDMQTSLDGLATTQIGRGKVDGLRREVQELGDSAAQLAAAVDDRFKLSGKRARLLADAIATHRKLAEKTTPLFDDAYFKLVMDLRAASEGANRENGKVDLKRLANEELEILDGLSELRIESNLLLAILTEISLAPSVQLFPPLRDSLLAAEVRASKAVAKLASTEHARDLKEALAGLLSYGQPNTGIPHERERELNAIAHGWGLVAHNRSKSAALSAHVEQTAREAREEMSSAIAGSSAAIARSRLALLAIIVVCLLALVAAWVFISVDIVGRLRRLHDAVVGVAGGNFAVEVPKGGRDELSVMANAVATFKANAIEKIRLEREAQDEREKAEQEREKAEQMRLKAAAGEAANNRERARAIELIAGGLAKLADKDLTYRLGDDMPEDYRQLQTDFNRMCDEVGSIVGRIAQSSGAVQGATLEIGSGVVNLSERTEQQASALEETAASMEQMSATVRQNASNAQEANRAATSTRALAVSSGEIAGQAVAAMSKIEDSSRQITEIVGLIEEIAFQTNILALNAAVEAARAGDAGRGFAVVANEVRALSQRSSQALKEIKKQIVSSDASVRDGVRLVKQAGASLGEIVESVKRVAGLVAEIAAASQEQSSGIDQVSKAIGSMDQLTQQNAALVEETNAALQSAQTQVDELQQAVAFFKTGQEMRSAAARSAPAAHNPVHRQQGMLARRVAPRRGGAAAAAAEDFKEF